MKNSNLLCRIENDCPEKIISGLPADWLSCLSLFTLILLTGFGAKAMAQPASLTQTISGADDQQRCGGKSNTEVCGQHNGTVSKEPEAPDLHADNLPLSTLISQSEKQRIYTPQGRKSKPSTEVLSPFFNQQFGPKTNGKAISDWLSEHQADAKKTDISIHKLKTE